MDSREYPTRPIVAVGIVVLKGDQVLLVRRGVPPAFGKWSVPGGGVELEETLQEAAVRELKEECDLEVEFGPAIESIDRLIYDEDGKLQYHYVIVDFVARWVAGEPVAATDVSDARWVPVDQLRTMDTTTGLAEVVECAVAAARSLPKFPQPRTFAGPGFKGGNYACPPPQRCLLRSKSDRREQSK